MGKQDENVAGAALARAGLDVPDDMRPDVLAAMQALRQLAAKLKNWNPS